MPLINEPYDYTTDEDRRPSPSVGCLPYLYVGLVLIVIVVVAGAL